MAFKHKDYAIQHFTLLFKFKVLTSVTHLIYGKTYIIDHKKVTVITINFALKWENEVYLIHLNITNLCSVILENKVMIFILFYYF